MSNELMKVTATEAIQLGKNFYDSGLFTDIKSAQQAVVKIMAGAEIGIPPFASMSGIHIIQGKPTIGAGLIASSVKGSGKYDYKVIEQTEKNCSIDFYQGKEKIGNSSFSIEDARKAGTKNVDKFPRNMLFARAISNGVKWFCPDVFAGPVYVPEEMETIEDIQHEEVRLPAISDKAFGKAVERINKGEINLIEKLRATYTLTDGQKSILAVSGLPDSKELLHTANEKETSDIQQ